MLRVLYGKTKEQVWAALDTWVTALLNRGNSFDEQKNAIYDWYLSFKTMLRKAPKEEVEMKSRAVMRRLVDVVEGLLLLADAQSDGDEIARHVLESWTSLKLDNGAMEGKAPWKDEAERDLKIVFGLQGPQNMASREAKL